MEGNEAIGWGALKAGCSFFVGYSITPATTIYNTMLKRLPPNGGICLQGEDEIASIGFCPGASMAVMKTMTATSGPGISLYSEQISFAIGSEIPIVSVDKNIHRTCLEAAEQRGIPGNYMNGSNIAGFVKVVNAMVDQGAV